MSTSHTGLLHGLAVPKGKARQSFPSFPPVRICRYVYQNCTPERGHYQTTDGSKLRLHSCSVLNKFRQLSNESCFTLPVFQPFLSTTSLTPEAAFIQLHAHQVDRAQKLAHLRVSLRSDNLLSPHTAQQQEH